MKTVVDATLWNCTKDEPCVLVKKNKSFRGGKYYKVCEERRYNNPDALRNTVSIMATSETSEKVEDDLKNKYNIVRVIELDNVNQ